MNSSMACDRRVALIQSRLHSLFGGEFVAWERMAEGWQLLPSRLLPGGMGAGFDWTSHQLPLHQWFEEIVASEGQACHSTWIHGYHFVATNLCTDGEPYVVVAGLVQTDVRLLAERAASMAIVQAEHEAETQMQQQLVDQYANRLTESYEELTFLRRLSRHIEYCGADRSLAEAAHTILPQIRELADLEGLCLVGVDSRAPANSPGDLVGCVGSFTNFDFAGSLIEHLGPASHSVYVRNYLSELASDDIRPQVGIRSLVVVPIEKDGVVFGWLVGVNKRGAQHEFVDGIGPEIGSVEASLLEAAALMLGSHAANNRLFREKESLVVEVIHTLVGVIEAKDVYTVGHSDRVALIGRCLGKELGLPAEACQDIFLSGLLHDIGKIGIADDVLLKPGNLTDEEFAQIKTHPERGARLIQVLKPLEKLIPGVLHHHEAIDGSGYPHGLVGEQIPLMARVLAVADAFDAMTSDRPYRTGMPLSKAEEILRSGAGKQWDSDVVNAYFSARSEIVEIGLQWQDHLRSLLDWRGDCEDCGERVQLNSLPQSSSLNGDLVKT